MTKTTAKATHAAPGTFSWVELSTSENEGAKQFYTKLFGWDSHFDMDQVMRPDSKITHGLPEMPPKQVPPYWISFVSVINVDETAAKVEEAGGRLIREPFTDATGGRMAIAQDPTGADFGLCETGTPHGDIVNVPNLFCWHELGTEDPVRASAFYAEVFGWNANELTVGAPCYSLDYTVLMNGERPVGAIYRSLTEAGQVPPHWIVYFSVDDCTAAAETAVSLGAKMIAQVTPIPTIGTFSSFLDPQGVAFAIAQLQFNDIATLNRHSDFRTLGKSK